MRLELYEILQIDRNATVREIKRAYVQRIRQYSPEKHPEEFNRIRRAYETLSDPKNRQEYDTMAEHGEEITELMDEVERLIEQERFEEAAKCCRKMIMIAPHLDTARNKYALCLMYQEDFEKALPQFERLVNENPGNATYYFNLAIALDQLERPQEAIHSFLKAYELDSNNVNIIFELADLYQRLNQMQEARTLIERVVGASASTDFHPFIYLFKLLKMEILEKNEQGIESTFLRIEAILERHEEEKKYVAMQYADFAYKLYEYKMYKWAVLLTERAVTLDPEHPFIQELHESTAKKKPLYEEYDNLKEDDDVAGEIKNIFLLYLFGDEVTEEEFETYEDRMFESLFLSAKYNSHETIKSIKRVMIHYPSLYEVRKEILQRTLEQSKKYKIVHDEFTRMKSDAAMANAFPRLISLWMTHDLDDDERSNYFDTIMDDLSTYTLEAVYRSVTRLETEYPSCYKLNVDFFNDIKARSKPTSDSRNKSVPETRQPSHPARPSSSASTYSAPNSSSSSCFVATVAYGTPLTEELDILRLWRDQRLKETISGRLFVRVYYQHGMKLARIVDKSERLKSCVRGLLQLWVAYLSPRLK